MWVGPWCVTSLIGSECSSSRKLAILFVVIAAAVIVLEFGVIVSVVRSTVLSKGCKPFMKDFTRAAT